MLRDAVSFGPVSDWGSSGPSVDGGRCWTKNGAEVCEVVGVAGEDVLAEADGGDDEVGVDDVGGSGLGEELADWASVVEWVDHDGFEEGGKAGLAGSGAPYLCQHGVGGVECSLGLGCGCDKGVGCSFAAIDGDEESCVKDHRPYRSAMAATSSSSIGPCSESQSARNERRAFWRLRSAAR